ncbi:NAD(+) salvage pathway protein [Lecanora helva]
MTGSNVEKPFRPALLVVDMQEDFCPPHGTLPIAGAREIVPLINELLALPFALKIATQDFHPPDHISFDISNSPPNNVAFKSFVDIQNPHKPDQSYKIPVWPVHCVQGTKGAEILSEIDASKFHHVVQKGINSRMEMFSGFADVFGSKSSVSASENLTELLRNAGISHVFNVGVAGEHCVRCTALDAKKEGFKVFVVEEAVRSVDAGENGWDSAKNQFQNAGIDIVHIDGHEVNEVKNLS